MGLSHDEHAADLHLPLLAHVDGISRDALQHATGQVTLGAGECITLSELADEFNFVLVDQLSAVIEEVVPDGWTLVAIDCGADEDGIDLPAVTITFDPFEEVPTCTFFNEQDETPPSGDDDDDEETPPTTQRPPRQSDVGGVRQPGQPGVGTGDGSYRVAGERLSSTELVAYYEQLVAQFPIWSIEDGMAENDDDGWHTITDALGERLQLMGDDNFVTDPRRIEQAAADHVANSSLIKLNQIGSVTETLDALAVCRKVGFAAMISHRSGETDDSFIADLAVASGCGQLKSGAPARGERVAKYNRLLTITDREPELPFGLPDR